MRPLMGTLIMGKTVHVGQGTSGNFLDHLLNFAVNLKLLKINEVLKKRQSREQENICKSYI